ncbi:MAG: hypothetical protein ACD_12C00847G0001, partial [uncultured bacterium]
MDPKDILKNIIPSPFSEQSTLSGLAKKGELLGEGLSFTTIIKNVVFLLILAFVLVGYFKISASIVAILIGTEILITLIAGYIKIRKIKSIYAIGTLDNAKSYRNILITGEYYELIKAIFGVGANIISVVLVFLLFSREITNFVIQNIPLQAGLLKYFILIFVVFRLFDFIVRLVRYHWIKNLKENDDLAQVNQEYQLIGKKLELIKFIPEMSVILLIIFLIGIPLYIPLIFGGFMLLMVVLSIVELQRIKNITFNNKQVDASVVQHAIVEYQDEQIAGSVFGIMKTAAGFKDIFKPFGMSVLGSGKTYYPENTLLVTNYRILLIQVPITGGNKIVGETNYVPQNFFFNRGELRQQGEELLKANALSQILKLATNDVLYNDIKLLTLKQTQIIIEKMTGEKLSYVFMDREYIDSLKQLFSLYLKEK